ncbi:MAG: DNA double-strand break repair nuclease NurA [Crenarchaeota archaeon]|nr:DNA double-strand break repair nuclease NurA [Thermoproteota archaeon]
MDEDVIIYDSVEEFVKDFSREFNAAAIEVEKLREKLGDLIKRYKCGSAANTIDSVVVDTAYPPSPIDLLGLSISIIGCAVLGVRGGRLAEQHTSHVVLASRRGLDQDYVAAYARLIERREALRHVEDGGYELVVFDGEVVPYKCLYSRRPRGAWRTYCNDIGALVDRLTRSVKALVGVIKRSYSSILSLYGIDLSDKHAASIILRRGEYVVAGKTISSSLGIELVEVYYKPLRGMPLAVKLEIGARRVDESLVEGIVEHLACTSSPTGLPIFIDLVDALARRELRVVDAVRRYMLSRVGGGASVSTNPQKYYLEGRL